MSDAIKSNAIETMSRGARRIQLRRQTICAKIGLLFNALGQRYAVVFTRAGTHR